MWFYLDMSGCVSLEKTRKGRIILKNFYETGKVNSRGPDGLLKSLNSFGFLLWIDLPIFLDID